jgi:hypothetical protein
MGVSLKLLLFLLVGTWVPSSNGQELPQNEDKLKRGFLSPEAQAQLRGLNLVRELKQSDSTTLVNRIRELQSTRACNEQFATATADEILAIGDFFLGLIIPPELSALLPIAREEFFSIVKYDIAVSKVCLSCSDVQAMDFGDAGAMTNGAKYGFLTYCSSDKYGFEATHSALVFQPVNATTGEKVEGVLRGFVSGHSTETDVTQGPSDFWPDSISGILDSDVLANSTKVIILRNFLTSSVAASAGTVAILPDYIGYGASKDFDRAFLAPMPYQQSFAVSYMAAKRYVSDTSDGCTQLEDVATVAGYSEGGLAAVNGALAMEQNGIQILSLHPGGTPFDVDTQIGFTLGTFFFSSNMVSADFDSLTSIFL